MWTDHHASPEIVQPLTLELRPISASLLAVTARLDRLALLVIEFRLAAQPDAVRHGTGAASQSNRNCSPGRAGGRNKSQRNGTRLRPSKPAAAATSNLRPIIHA